MYQEDVVIIGAGIAGLATALGLHRLGIRSVVLESSDDLRITGFALTTWPNAWRALDALSIGDILRQKSTPIQGFKVGSRIPQHPGSEQVPEPDAAGIDFGKNEIRCVKRRDLLETLVRELPQGTVRYSSRIVSIEESHESGYFKLLHLADGSVFQTKVLLGCDGINSLVAKWLGLQSPVSAGRSAIRGLVHYPDGHGFDPMFHVYFGGGVRYGIIPCDNTSVYWFCTFPPSLFKYDENEHDPQRMKQFVASNIVDIPKHASDLVERTELDSISCATLKLRVPWNVLLRKIAKGNVSVAGDALHPMTPDLGQGGCSALEDSIVLARCLGRALLDGAGDCKEHARIERGLGEYARERRWRSFRLISTAYAVGFVQESNASWIRFLVKAFMSKYTLATMFRMSQFDCGELVVS